MRMMTSETMARLAASGINKIAGRLGLEVRRRRPATPGDPQQQLFESLLAIRDAVPSADDESLAFLSFCTQNLMKSRSQLFQDLFVAYHFKEKHNGYFVEFGATDGIELNNTYLLESDYGWTGILAEPARVWHSKLQNNRHGKIDFRCVWSKTGAQLQFSEAGIPELSGIVALARGQSEDQSSTVRYAVETVSLLDLLACHEAPKVIDYLSIDTEGAEFEILSQFNFLEYDVRAITVEHAYVQPDRERLFKLLTSNGYRRVFDRFSYFDDWYVKIQ